jgi:hypothetical protein
LQGFYCNLPKAPALLPVADANINDIMIHLPTAAHRTRQTTLISIITGGDATTFVRVKGEVGTRSNPTLANASAGLAQIAHGFRTSVVLHLSVAAIWASVSVDVRAEIGGSDKCDGIFTQPSIFY